MLVMVRLKNAKPAVRGEVSQLLIEVEPCTYIGDISDRVREELWKLLASSMGVNGSAWMVYPSSSYQKMAVLSCNTDWSVVDFDGIYMIERSLKTVNEGCASPLF